MLRKSIPDTIAPYLTDASNFSGGSATEVVIPETLEDLVSFLKYNTNPVTVSGAGTGVTASRIPLSGIVISLEKFKGIGEISNNSIRVEAAVTLAELQKKLLSSKYFYPPNPTETLASIGGTLSTNASGSRSYKFGATRNFVQGALIILVDGRSARVNRGQKISDSLILDDGSEINFPSIQYISPGIKNASGYYIKPDMDWIDLFIGAEGTLGIIVEIDLKLLPAPSDFLSGILFFENEEQCWELVQKIRDINGNDISPCSVEYFDKNSLLKLKTKDEDIPPSAEAALFFEQEYYNSADYENALDQWYKFLTEEKVSLENSWFSNGPNDLKKFHEFRHRLPLIINEENSRQGRVKIGTDMAVPDKFFIELMQFYRKTLEKSNLDYVVFGHIGDNHLHVNLLPQEDEISLAKNLYGEMVDQVLNWEGTISAEHGIGKLKKEYFKRMVGQNVLEQMQCIKKLFDPSGLLGRGTLF
ncbi:MAG: FAD-binding oxidoreductase [Nitrospinales bacterium]